MIPVLFAADGTRIGNLTDCTRNYITQERNGLYEAEIDYPMDGELFSQIEKGFYILVKPDDISQPQKMRIYKQSKPLYGITTFYCEHERYKLNNVPVARGQYTGTPSAIIGSMAASVDGASDFTFWSDIDTIKTINLNTPSTVGQMIGGTEGSVLDVFGGEYEFDNTTIKLYSSRGQERTAEIRYAKNLTGFTCETDISTAYTHVYPYFYNETDDQYVELTNKKIAISGTSGLPYRCYMLDLSGEFETAPTEAQLESKARSFISSNHLGQISRNYKVSFVPLWQTEEYKNVAVLERCSLCDTVPVVHEKAGEKIKAKIIRTVYDGLAERYVEMELGNAVSSFSKTVTQSINKVNENLSKTRSYMQIVIARSTAKIVGNKGGYIVLYDSDGDGQPDEILIMNTPSILTATKVWRWNMAGLGYSSHGYAGPYETAVTMDGEIVADFITAGTLSASLIKAGTLQDINQIISFNLENGTFSINQSNSRGSINMNAEGVFFNINGTNKMRLFIQRNGQPVIICEGQPTIELGSNFKITNGDVMIETGTVINDWKVNGDLKVGGYTFQPRNLTINGNTYTLLGT